jgi:hypothetical protein
MGKTRHFQRRMSQRGMTLELVELARQFGEPTQDKIVLGRKGLGQLLGAVRDIERIPSSRPWIKAELSLSRMGTR